MIRWVLLAVVTLTLGACVMADDELPEDDIGWTESEVEIPIQAAGCGEDPPKKEICDNGIDDDCDGQVDEEDCTDDDGGCWTCNGL